MEKINFQNGVTKVNADTFNTFQNNIENAINNIQISEATPSSRFGQIDINKIIINNKVVEIEFRGYTTEQIPNNEVVIENIPKPAWGVTLATGLGEQYNIDHMIWQYIQGPNNIRGQEIPAGNWVHIHVVYIKE